MRGAFPDFEPKGPLKDVPEDAGPILANASLTFTEQASGEGHPLPISQIAIEL